MTHLLTACRPSAATPATACSMQYRIVKPHTALSSHHNAAKIIVEVIQRLVNVNRRLYKELTMPACRSTAYVLLFDPSTSIFERIGFSTPCEDSTRVIMQWLQSARPDPLRWSSSVVEKAGAIHCTNMWRHGPSLLAKHPNKVDNDDSAQTRPHQYNAIFAFKTNRRPAREWKDDADKIAME